MRQPILNNAFFIPRFIFQPYSAPVLDKVARLPTLQLNSQGYSNPPLRIKRRALFSCTPRNTLFSPQNQHQQSRRAMATDSVPTVAGLSIHSTTSEVSKYPNCYPAVNPIDTYRAHIAELVGEALGIDSQSVYPKIQWTNSLDKGDLVLAVPALQIKGKKPAEVTAQILENLPPSDLISTPVVSGAHMQFYFKAEPLTKTVISSILENRATYGTNANVGLRNPADPSKGKKKIIVEFSSPNIAKPFHAGHLRSTIIGGFLANLYTVMGWEVIKMNYLGDWGKQYGLLANGYEKYGNEEELVKDPINHLFDVYVKINKDVAEQEGPIKELREQIKAKKEKNEDTTELEKDLQAKIDVSYDEKARRYFKSMEDGDEGALALWRRFRDLSIEKYRETYARLNIDFDRYSGESQVKPESLAKAYEVMAKTGVSENSEGAVIVDFAKHGAKKLGKAIVVRKDGTPLYLTRDIAAIVERDEEYHFDRMIYVVAAQQDLHLAQLFKVTELVGRKDLADRCQHVNFGMVRGMSTRKGTVKFLNDILKDVGEKMHEVMKKNTTKYEQVENPEQTADILGITSVMVQDMSGKRINGYEFNLDDMTSFEGDTGPYLQYAHARLCSMTRKAEIDQSELSSADLSLLTEPHAIDLIRLLASWPDVVFNTTKTLEPTTILTYLFRMTHVLSSGYDVLKVVGSEPELKKARMAMYDCARQVLHNGMRLLGLNPVERYVFPPFLPLSLSFRVALPFLCLPFIP
ncbi:arginine-tRNA ligase [Emergomyces pasteurianus Ep9510]|uniref:arginine--tRNA ligase n=1 Tax=Emergomyces pasteurianus Ep9510 TaxID=1447872 RepID=A0A1J9QRA9_9EURO|nr:arginine-tRNA ligase [Emergomyces pasteurianus Ep9510]